MKYRHPSALRFQVSVSGTSMPESAEATSTAQTLNSSLCFRKGSVPNMAVLKCSASERNFAISPALYPSPRMTISTFFCGSPFFMSGMTRGLTRGFSLMTSAGSAGLIRAENSSWKIIRRSRRAIVICTAARGKGNRTDSENVRRTPSPASAVVCHSLNMVEYPRDQMSAPVPSSNTRTRYSPRLSVSSRFTLLPGQAPSSSTRSRENCSSPFVPAW